MEPFNKDKDDFDAIIVQTDTLFMRIRMLFSEHVMKSIDIIGTDVGKLDIVVPFDAGGAVEQLMINTISVNEEELLFVETSDGRKILWDDLNIYAQQIVVDTLHHGVKVFQALNKFSGSGPVN